MIKTDLGSRKHEVRPLRDLN